MKTIVLFVSSPSDVMNERKYIKSILERLKKEFYSYNINLQPYFWEDGIYEATKGYQDQIMELLKVDILLCLLYSRMGTPVTIEMKTPNGLITKKTYDSGTAFEFESALEAKKRTGSPQIYVYKRNIDSSQNPSDREQLDRLNAFILHWFGNEEKGYVGSLHYYQDPLDFNSFIEKHLRTIIISYLQSHSTADEANLMDAITNPYRGLKRFEFEHASLYFGRDKAITEISDKLICCDKWEYSYVMIVGRSGSGKSSLIRAGVIPRLLKNKHSFANCLWKWCIFRPGDNKSSLLRGLADTLAKAFPLSLNNSGIDIAKDLESSFSGDYNISLTLLQQMVSAEISAASVNESIPTDYRIILVIDQMEELFTLNYPREIVEGFLHLLAFLTQHKKIWVISTLRSDFYANCLEYEILVEMKKNGLYDLTTPTVNDITQMVKYPAAVYGVQFERLDSGEGLDDIIIEKAAQNVYSLPLLEYLLEQLYLKKIKDSFNNIILTYEAYHEIGEFEGAISNAGEKTLMSLTPEQQKEFPFVVLKMITFDKSNYDKAGSKRIELAKLELQNNPARKRMVDAFIDARLFVVEESTDGNIISMAHEALLSSWLRLSELIQENQEKIKLRDQLIQSANLWVNENRDMAYLLPQGTLLEQAEDLLFHSSVIIDGEAVLISFIKESIKRLQKSRRKSNFLFGCALITLTMVSMSLWYMWSNGLSKENAVTKANSSMDEMRSELDTLENELDLAKTDRFNDINFSDNGRFIVLLSENIVDVYDANAGEKIDAVSLPKEDINVVRFFSSDTILIGTEQGNLYSKVIGSNTLNCYPAKQPIDFITVSNGNESLLVSQAMETQLFDMNSLKFTPFISKEKMIHYLWEALDKTEFSLDETDMNFGLNQPPLAKVNMDGDYVALNYFGEINGDVSCNYLLLFNLRTTELLHSWTFDDRYLIFDFNKEGKILFIDSSQGFISYSIP